VSRCARAAGAAKSRHVRLRVEQGTCG
jgi:hypothetical protein